MLKDEILALARAVSWTDLCPPLAEKILRLNRLDWAGVGFRVTLAGLWDLPGCRGGWQHSLRPRYG